MTTTNVPSDQFDDLKRDVEDATRYSNSETVFTNRVGKQIRPIPLQAQDIADNLAAAEQALANSGFIPKGDFTTGGTVEAKNEVFSDGADYWRYDGALPFTVTAGSSPTPTGVGAWINVTDGTLRSQLAAVDSTVLIGGKEAGKVAKATTLITPAEWGILADGSDETTKWQGLITFCATNRLGIGAFQGETLITSQLTLPSGFGGIYGDSQLHMVFKKGFNGELFSLNAQGLVLDNFWIQGDGSNFTGGGVYVVSDNIDLSHIRIEDTADSPVICKANDSTFLNVTNSHLAATDNVNTPAIRSDGVDISTGPTVRKFDKISGAQYLLDASGMNEYTLCNSLFSKITFDSNSSKGKHFGNRITAANNNVTVLGADHVFFGNIISMGASNDFIIDGVNITFDESNRYSKGTNSKATPVLNGIYGGAITHSVTTKLTDVSSDLILKGSTSDWVKGNSSVTAYYTLHDQKCYYTFQLIRGSTATNPVGTFSVTLPFKALVGSQGSVLIKSSTGTYYTGTLQVFGGGNSATLWINLSTESINDSSIAFGTNATVQGTLEYLVSST